MPGRTTDHDLLAISTGIAAAGEAAVCCPYVSGAERGGGAWLAGTLRRHPRAATRQLVAGEERG